MASLSDVLAGLYKSLGLNLANLDYEEQGKRRGLVTNLENAAKTRVNALRSSSINMADRGMTQSGVALQQATNVNLAGDENIAQLNQGFNDDLSSIARKRVGAESDYNLRKLELERQATAQQDPLSALPTATPTPSAVSNSVSMAQQSISSSARKAVNTSPPRSNNSVTKSAPRKIATPVAKAPAKVRMRLS